MKIFTRLSLFTMLFMGSICTYAQELPLEVVRISYPLNQVKADIDYNPEIEYSPNDTTLLEGTELYLSYAMANSTEDLEDSAYMLVDTFEVPGNVDTSGSGFIVWPAIQFTGKANDQRFIKLLAMQGEDTMLATIKSVKIVNKLVRDVAVEVTSPAEILKITDAYPMAFSLTNEGTATIPAGAVMRIIPQLISSVNQSQVLNTLNVTLNEPIGPGETVPIATQQRFFFTNLFTNPIDPNDPNAQFCANIFWLQDASTPIRVDGDRSNNRNCATVNMVDNAALSVNEVLSEISSIYYEGGQIFFNFQNGWESGLYSFDVINTSGQVIASSTEVINNQAQVSKAISMSAAHSGVYMLRVSSNDGFQLIKKFMVR